MSTVARLTDAGIADLTQLLPPSTEELDAPVSSSADQQLRLLALLNLILRKLTEDTAKNICDSPTRATELALLTEDLVKTMTRVQLVAAGKLEDSAAHTLQEEPLIALNEVHEHLEKFIDGSVQLPQDACNPTGTKMLYKDTAEFCKAQMHLSKAQATHRLISCELLLPHTGFNGRQVPPRFKVLGDVLDGGKADPTQIALAARKLVALQPGIDAQKDPQATAEHIENVLADSLVGRNPGGTGQLFKHFTAHLDATALEQAEEKLEPYVGLRCKGRHVRGYVWEICTDLQGHELLTTVAALVANPRSRFGQETDTQTGISSNDSKEAAKPRQPELPGFGNAEKEAATSPEAAQLPDWAADPDMPEQQRPRAEFLDVGGTDPSSDDGPFVELLPGESLEAARERIKARGLLQFVLDSIRFMASDDRERSPELPMKPNIDMLVTISWDSLVGKLNDPGITGNNQLISAGSARRMACSANIIPVVLGTQSEPLDLGRTQRFFSRAQRRAMALRDKGCINPGCSMPAYRCEANHIQPWYLGGKTDLCNGALLCPTCHASFHAEHLKIIFVGAIPYVLQNRALDPEQKLRRNWFYHPEAATI
ncbi:hypothetical protein CQ018_02175 [Arthrobacter sp. MYb227]|uniref:HNH endonuclease signature motif containing protein n=1 Tax=Arthrobacter sp. MYb227 TaxID=1848601 RepID=UPI000CFDB928|nr:HNH endonuclease signature motif containing protein [Arthrobacter sp. MYb227]PQZ96111.1 hypothetical protein CQ018_02175 [Arthrobacter sp. MYb227]